MAAYNDSAQKTPAVRKNVRGMNAPNHYNQASFQQGFLLELLVFLGLMFFRTL